MSDSGTVLCEQLPLKNFLQNFSSFILTNLGEFKQILQDLSKKKRKFFKNFFRVINQCEHNQCNKYINISIVADVKGIYKTSQMKGYTLLTL